MTSVFITIHSNSFGALEVNEWRRGAQPKSRCAAPLGLTPTELIEDSPKPNDPKSSGVSRQYAVFFEFDENPSNIKDVLDLLHPRCPALTYPQLEYEQQLRIHRIHDLASASKFDAAFYNSVIGMDYGAAYLFCEWVIQKLGMHESRKRKIGVDGSMTFKLSSLLTSISSISITASSVLAESSQTNW
jgi:hypothetical protein